MLLPRKREHRILKNQVLQFFFPKTTDSFCLCLSLLMCVSLFSLSLSLSQSFAPKFATRTTPSRLWDGYLPNKQPHLENSGLLQLSSLASKPALCVSLCPSVPLCVCVCVLLSFSLSLCLSFGFSHVILRLLSGFFWVCGSLPLYWFLCFCEFLCFGFLTQFFATCWRDLLGGPNKFDGYPRLPNKLASSIVDQGTLIARQEEEKSREARSKTRDPMRTCTATCGAAAAAPARQAATVASHEKKHCPSFYLSKRKTLDSPRKTTSPRVGGRLSEANMGHLMVIRRVC
jgi:hypothetical protein